MSSVASPAPPPARLPGRTVAAILLGNLVPVFGVLFLGWSAGQILILYWVENIVIGVLTLPRILTAQGPVRDRAVFSGTGLGERLFLAGFFAFHYGAFTMGHGFFAVMLASQQGGPDPSQFSFIGDLLTNAEFLLACAAVAGVQVFLFVREWILSGLWRTSEPKTEMGRPYGRIFVLHIAVLLGAFALASLGAPAWTVLILCVGKALLELAQARAAKTAETAQS